MRRRSLQLNGLAPEFVQQLAVIDEEFYGSASSDASSADSEDADVEPPAKRARDDESYSDSSELSDGSGASDAEEDIAYLQVCGKFQNLLDGGSGCREGKTNHY